MTHESSPQFSSVDGLALAESSVPNGGGPYFSRTRADRGQVIVRADRLADDVEVDRAEHGVVGLVARPDVLDEPRVGIGPGVVLLPAEAGVAPRDLDERHEALLVQVVDLAIDVAEVGRVDAVHVGEHVLVARDLAGEEERPAALVVHVLGAVGPELEPGRADGGLLRVVHDDVPGLAVGHPVRKRGDDVDPVEALRLAVADVVLEPRRGPDRALADRRRTI